MTEAGNVAATGHRPDKLGGYGPDVAHRLKNLAAEYMIRTPGITAAISGMALGWDMAWAEAALDLDIPLWAAVPFEGQEKIWPESSQRRYRELLKQANRVVVVCQGGYEPWKMQRRNKWMVAKCDRLAALWDGSRGGTFNCVAAAQQSKRPIDYLWNEWTKP